MLHQLFRDRARSRARPARVVLVEAFALSEGLAFRWNFGLMNATLEQRIRVRGVIRK